MDLIVTIYNKLDEKSPYRSDIFDLFGTQDGMTQGIIGTKRGKAFKSLEWDWGLNGIKKVCKFLYWNRCRNFDGFDRWYRDHKTSEFKNLIESIDKLLYVFNYKGYKIAAFIARVEKIERRSGRLWFKFTPAKFVLLPPEFMEDYHKCFFSGGREDPAKWEAFYGNESEHENFREGLKEICSSASSQDQYHLVPVAYLEQWIEQKTEPSESTKPIFVATIEDNEKLLKRNLHTNNQIFWSIFSEYIGRSQVKGSFSIIERGTTYRITDIPVNSFTERGLVYNQEVGTPYIIFQVLSDIYQERGLKEGEENRFIQEEFSQRNKTEISIFESKFLRRAGRVSDIVTKYEKEYAATDYDYVLELEKLGRRKTVLFDLTSGLWYKWIGRDKEEFVNQWLHNIVEVPKRNADVIAIWYYGLERYEAHKGQEIGKYLIEKGGLAEDQYLYVTSSAKIEVPKNLKVVFLPLYDDNSEYHGLKRELGLLDPMLDIRKCRQSCLYRSWREVAKHLLKV